LMKIEETGKVGEREMGNVFRARKVTASGY
jgi:hypothetical protein